MQRLLPVWLALAVLGCDGPTTTIAPNEPGALAVSWTGRDTGQFVAAARASWCAADSMLQVLATRGDTGVGFALLAQDSVRPNQYPVMTPEIVVDWRPLASAAVRWMGSAEVKGYQAYSGVINVTAVDSGPTGTLDVRLKVPGADADTLRLTGTFTALAVVPAEGACGRATRPGRP
jgi:hypothetical protein